MTDEIVTEVGNWMQTEALYACLDRDANAYLTGVFPDMPERLRNLIVSTWRKDAVEALARACEMGLAAVEEALVRYEAYAGLVKDD